MIRWTHGLAMGVGLLMAACGGNTSDTAATTATDTAKQSDPNATFGPLGVGADYERYTKVNARPVPSGDHGGRFVDTWVNDIGLEAYQDPDEEAEIPVGSIIVKSSWESDGEQPTDVAGPIFVMEKRAPGFDPDNGDWYYAMHWAEPSEKFLKSLGGPVYWQSPSPKVNYCWKCHNGYDRQLGTVPEDYRN
ncbi:MAG: hypothetical protein Tsb0020_55220 [Haliangiales bacterium]